MKRRFFKSRLASQFSSFDFRLLQTSSVLINAPFRRLNVEHEVVIVSSTGSTFNQLDQPPGPPCFC